MPGWRITKSGENTKEDTVQGRKQQMALEESTKDDVRK